MTEKLYEVDSYVQNFTAQVVSCTPVPGGFAVVLDRTAFFPEGGGQPCDTGRLGGARVLAVHTDGETITHTTDAPLTAGVLEAVSLPEEAAWVRAARAEVADVAWDALLFTAKEALRCRGDNRVFWVYLKNSLFARG